MSKGTFKESAEVELFPKRLINVVKQLQVWLSTGMLGLIFEAINQEGEKGDGKDEGTEMERQADVEVGSEASL